MRRTKARNELLKDLLLIFFGAVVAIVLSKLGIVAFITDLFGGRELASFIAGIFFTSAFTIAPATLVLGDLSFGGPILPVAFWGALGATFGDLIIFFYIRDKFATDLMSSLRPSLARKIMNSFHLGFLKWLSPLVGAAIIASPLPDELGLTLLGISRTKVAILIPISFAMNMLGIYLVALFALQII